MDWTRMLKAVPSTGIEVSTSSLKRHAALLTYFATTSASYIESLVGQRPFVNNILNMAEKAREYLDTDCLAALAEAMRASAYASAMLNTVFTTNLGGTADRLRNAALEAAGEAIASGFDPIVALSYIERGDTLRGVDDASAIYFYDLALINTMWYLIIGGGAHAHTATYTYTHTQTSSTSSAPRTAAGTSTTSRPAATASTTRTGAQTTVTRSTSPSTTSSTSSTHSQTVTTVTISSGGATVTHPAPVLSNAAVLAVAVGVGAVLGAVLGALLSRRPR
jgi:predicted S18 family serine protease